MVHEMRPFDVLKQEGCMRPKQYRVELSDSERAELLLLVRRGKAPARAIQRAHILLRASEDAPDAETARALHTSIATVARTRQRFAAAPVGERLGHGLYDRPRPGAKPKLGAKQEAFLVALACSDAPDGRTYWTMQLLADRLVALEVVDAISDETVRRTLKKTG
jgi:Homeodomain-like domain